MQRVDSPIGTRRNSALKPLHLGSCPQLDAQVGLAPVEAFTSRMIEERDAIVRLMMWDICQPLDYTILA